MTIARVTLGTIDDTIHPTALKAVLAEFISTFIFVFAARGSSIAFSKLTYGNGVITPTGLLFSALANAFSLSVAISISTNISGGHVNPAVTFGVFIGGRITLFRGIMYWLAQLLGATFACLLLQFCTSGGSVVMVGLSVDDFVQMLALEAVMTFGLVFTVYALALNPTKERSTSTPIAIGFITGANILVGGAFEGASMNPAASFGPALVGWAWKKQWIHWLGPIAGSTAAGLVQQIFFWSQY